MKLAELKNKPAEEQQRLLNSERQHLQELRFNAATNQLKNVRAIRQSRLLIARILTLLTGQSAPRIAGASNRDQSATKLKRE